MKKESAFVKDRVKEILGTEQYSSSSERLTRMLKDVDPKSLIKLNANENFYIPQSRISEILKEVADDTDLRVYPQREEAILLEALGGYVGFPSDWIAVGNGADQLIESIVVSFLRDSEEAISYQPTFPMYRIHVNKNRSKFIEIPLTSDFSLDSDALLSKVTPKTVLCFMCSPNNPTANQFKPNFIQKVVEEFKGLIILDEAYVEFAPHSLIHLVKKFDNLMVLRTFSKIFGLAGLRVGYAVSNPGLIGALKRTQLPFPINTVSMNVAHRMLQEGELVKEALKKLKEERENVIRRLNSIDGVKAYNSDTNFILIRVNKNSDYVCEKLLEQKILVRKVGKILGLGEHIRVTVGLSEMNAKLVSVLEDICSDEPH